MVTILCLPFVMCWCCYFSHCLLSKFCVVSHCVNILIITTHFTKGFSLQSLQMEFIHSYFRTPMTAVKEIEWDEIIIWIYPFSPPFDLNLFMFIIVKYICEVMWITSIFDGCHRSQMPPVRYERGIQYVNNDLTRVKIGKIKERWKLVW